MSIKDKIIKIFSVIFVVVVTLLLSVYIGYILDPKDSEDGLESIDAFHSLEKNSQDVIVYGSSMAWRGCDTKLMYDDYGINAYNYGCHWQALNTSLLFLQDSFRTQSPKVALVEMGLVGYVFKDIDVDGQIYYTHAISDFYGKRDYLKMCFGNNIGRYISYYLPITIFHDNWNKISSENFRAPEPEWYLERRGYFETNGIYEITIPKYYKPVQLEIPKDSIDILDKMVEECKKHGTKLIFFSALSANDNVYSDAITLYAKDHGADYVNFYELTKAINIDEKKDFEDTVHLNHSGAKKTAKYLAKYIIDKHYLD